MKLRNLLNSDATYDARFAAIKITGMAADTLDRLADKLDALIPWRRVMRPQLRHADLSNSSRPISMRRISLVPAPISYNFASRNSRPVG
jgi:hypothetical protein